MGSGGHARSPLGLPAGGERVCVRGLVFVCEVVINTCVGPPGPNYRLRNKNKPVPPGRRLGARRRFLDGEHESRAAARSGIVGTLPTETHRIGDELRRSRPRGLEQRGKDGSRASMADAPTHKRIACSWAVFPVVLWRRAHGRRRSCLAANGPSSPALSTPCTLIARQPCGHDLKASFSTAPAAARPRRSIQSRRLLQPWGRCGCVFWYSTLTTKVRRRSVAPMAIEHLRAPRWPSGDLFVSRRRPINNSEWLSAVNAAELRPTAAARTSSRHHRQRPLVSLKTTGWRTGGSTSASRRLSTWRTQHGRRWCEWQPAPSMCDILEPPRFLCRMCRLATRTTGNPLPYGGRIRRAGEDPSRMPQALVRRHGERG